MAKEVKLLAACGAGVNSSHQIKDAVEEEMKKRGHNVHVGCSYYYCSMFQS